MSTGSSTKWVSGWTVDDPAQIGYVSVGKDEGTWESWDADLDGRDLGLSAVSDGKIGCQHVRGTGTEAGEGEWHCWDLDFEFFYILNGSMKLQDQDGDDPRVRRRRRRLSPRVLLAPGDLPLRRPGMCTDHLAGAGHANRRSRHPTAGAGRDAGPRAQGRLHP